MVFTIDKEALDEVARRPGSLFLGPDKTVAATYRERDNMIFMFKGDFSGTAEECNEEMARLLEEDSKR